MSTDKLGDLLHPFPAITVSVCNLRPDSVGSCHATTRDVDTQPDIRLNYLSAQSDKQTAVKSVKQVRKIMVAKRLERYEPQEILPDSNVSTDAELLIEAGNIATTIFHPLAHARWEVMRCLS